MGSSYLSSMYSPPWDDAPCGLHVERNPLPCLQQFSIPMTQEPSSPDVLQNQPSSPTPPEAGVVNGGPSGVMRLSFAGSLRDHKSRLMVWVNHNGGILFRCGIIECCVLIPDRLQFGSHQKFKGHRDSTRLRLMPSACVASPRSVRNPISHHHFLPLSMNLISLFALALVLATIVVESMINLPKYR